jgi:hypothetical protein
MGCTLAKAIHEIPSGLEPGVLIWSSRTVQGRASKSVGTDTLRKRGRLKHKRPENSGAPSSQIRNAKLARLLCAVRVEHHQR